MGRCVLMARVVDFLFDTEYRKVSCYVHAVLDEHEIGEVPSRYICIDASLGVCTLHVVKREPA